MKKLKIEVGAKFGKWTVLKEVERRILCGKEIRNFLCKCECGTVRKVVIGSLTKGVSKGCGCRGNGIVNNRKRCCRCGENLSLSNFSKNEKATQGVKSYCKKCGNEAGRKQRKTKHGLLSKIFHQQKQSSIQRRHKQPSYTFEELEEWAMGKNIFHQLFNLWVKSGYDKEKTPSLDRINDKKGYTFDNLQIVKWRENYMNWHRKVRKGDEDNPTMYERTKVIKRGLCGKMLSSYISQSQASRVNKTQQANIHKCLIKQRNHAGGFLWEYDNE